MSGRRGRPRFENRKNVKAVIVRVNGAQTEVADGSTLAQLFDRLRLNANHVAVEVNLELIPRERHLQFCLSAGDQLEIVTLVGGG